MKVLNPLSWIEVLVIQRCAINMKYKYFVWTFLFFRFQHVYSQCFLIKSLKLEKDFFRLYLLLVIMYYVFVFGLVISGNSPFQLLDWKQEGCFVTWYIVLKSIHVLSAVDCLMCSCCSIETITLGDKRIGIKTSVLEEKATACNMLCCYADELKEGFFPYIDQVDSYLLFLCFHYHAFIELNINHAWMM